MNETDKQTTWQHEQRKLRIPITIVDEKTGEPVEILMRMIMNNVTLCGYGKTWTFSKSNKGTSVMDSRDNKRKPAPYILKELQRILGESAGNEAFNKLVN